MKKLFYIFLMLFTLNASANIKDTCKINSNHFDIIPSIVHSTLNSIISSDFNNLKIFCNGCVEYRVIENGKEYIEYGTEVKAIQNLNHLIIKFDIQNYRILTAKNTNGDDIIISELILSRDDRLYKLRLAFILDYNQSINKIIIY